METMNWSTLFGDSSERLQGLTEYMQLQNLGRTNLDRLVTLAQNHTQSLWQAGGAAQELRTLREEITKLSQARDAASEDKPLLPRLRIENFRVGDIVKIYLGDTPGALTIWATALITERTKSHRADWKNAPSEGYYWRHIAVGEKAFFPDSSSVAFATSEPRVISLSDWQALQKALQDDAAFVSLFAANALRDWQPLWCLERGMVADVATMDYKKWLRNG